MASLEEIENLQDELMLQQVMLNSIEGDPADDLEEDRRQRREEITELKRQIAFLKRQRSSAVRQDISADQGNIRDAYAHTPTPELSPAQDQQQIPLPMQPHMDPESIGLYDDAFAEGSHATPQSRKRNFDSTSLDVFGGDNKSRRTTPVRTNDAEDADAPWSSSHGSSKTIDYIDLTACDDEIDPGVIALQRQAEERAQMQREQQQSDRALAFRMSQSSEQQLASEPSAVDPAEPNAFNRIMASQRLNSQQLPPSSPFHVLGSSPEQPVDVASSWPNAMPGSYDSSWDQVSANPSHGFQGGNPSSFVLPSNAGSNSSPFVLPSNTGGNPSPFVLPSNTSGISGNASSSVQSMSPTEMGTVFSIGTLPTPNQSTTGNGFETLSQIINRTNSYDFVNGVDGFGNRLPAEIHDYVNHVVHDSKLDEKEIDDLLANIRPDMTIPETNRAGTPEGLKGALYRHQEIALTWMKDMEVGTNKGGILADDMGLGKTISMLALILSRPAKSKPKTNLIIGPLSLMKQWEEEISSKVKGTHRLSVFVYHGSKKNNISTDDLLKYDIVLTTYMTLAAQHKRLTTMLKESKDTGRPIDFANKAVITRIPLLQPRAKFYRIILDEAQCIKNVKTQSAQAVHELRATYRWCLSGTPMMNSVEELYSLIHFLKIKPYSAWHHFKNHFGILFGKGGEYTQTKAMGRLRTVLKAIMLRRKKDSTIDGKPILRLPPKTERVIHVELSPDERSFYNTLENKSKVIFNKYLREGSVGKHYTNILVLLLRLRQACCHPHLNLDVEDALTSLGEDMLRLVKELDPSIVSRIKDTELFECPICYDPVQSPCFFIPCGHDSCSSCLASLVDTSLAQSIHAGIEDTGSAVANCPVCRGQFDPTKCFTLEAFRKVHDPEKVKQEADEGGDGEDEDDGYSSSDSFSGSSESDDDDSDEVDEKGNLRDFIVSDDFKSEDDDEDSDEDELKPFRELEEFKPLLKSEDETKPLLKVEDEDSATAVEAAEAKERRKKAKKAKRKLKGKKKAEDIAADVKPSMLKALRKDAVKNKAAFKKYMAYLHKTWLPSAKATECLDLLEQIQKSGEKTIVFSQWTLLLDLIQVGMKHGNFAHEPVRYDGGMSAKDRNDAATKFRQSSTANVILVSLKAGNAGLNLAAASRVIILDPFWNPYIEMQAVDRAYRIGQQREVQVYRILSQETVEDRILGLQEKKKSMIESAMDENEGRKISRLTVGELRYLFNGD